MEYDSLMSWFEIRSVVAQKWKYKNRNDVSKLISFTIFDCNESFLKNFSTIIENYNYKKNFFVTKDYLNLCTGIKRL